MTFISNNLDDKINGISISPKNFNIIKLWYSSEVNQEEIILPEELNETKKNYYIEVINIILKKINKEIINLFFTL